MTSFDLALLDPWVGKSGKSGVLNVVVETIQGSRNKFKYDPSTRNFVLGKMLPRGMIFPFDFGFIPSTRGDDGDPLDVLILMSAPTFPGCRVPSRLIGVLEAEQTEHEETVRNDRLIGIPQDSPEHKDTRSVKELDKQLLAEIEHFFTSYNEMAGKRFKPLRWRGPRRASTLVGKGVKHFQGHNREETT